MAPKGVRKAKAVLSESKSKLAEALHGACAKEAEECPEATRHLLKRPAAAVPDAEAEAEEEPQRKLMKRPAAAAAADAEAEDEESEPEGPLMKRPAAARAEEAEAEDEAMEADECEEEDEAEEEQVLKKPAAAEAPAAAPAPRQAKAAAPAPAAPEEPAEPEEAPKPAKQPRPISKTQELINAVHSTIGSITHKASPAAGVVLHPGALTSFDEDGYPSTRTVIPSFIADDLTEVRISSQAGTRKEAEIGANPKVSLHFQDQRGKGGWVTLKGPAAMVPGSSALQVDIVLKPLRCEVMSYVEDIMGDDDGWKPATMVLAGGESWRRVH